MATQAVLIAGIFLIYISRIQTSPVASAQLAASKDKGEFQRLRELLDQLDLEGADGDQSEANTRAQEQGMRSLGQQDRQSFRATAEGLKKPEGPTQPRLAKNKEDSIQILAQALARMQMSQSRGDESEKGQGGANGNQLRQTDASAQEGFDKEEAARQLKQTIANALARMQDEDQSQRKLQRPKPPSFEDFREEAIRMVESRLLRDLSLADNLGLSVDDLIQDFEEKESRDEALQELENSLASLISDRDE